MGEALIELAPPRFEHGKALLITGLRERYNNDTGAGIPAQWQRFAPYIDNIPGQIGRVAYGIVCTTGDAGLFDYICGVEITGSASAQPDLIRMRIPKQKYAVFSHRDHISRIRSTFHAIFNRWLPGSGHKLARAPTLERYGEDFDPRSGFGGVEIWVPVQ